MAEQQRPVHRTVGLKIVKLGMSRLKAVLQLRSPG
jgi:hypothetical protein